MTTFETGKTYYYRFACNTDTVVKCTITKRTAKTITFNEDDGEVKTRRIYIRELRECKPRALLNGSYSQRRKGRIGDL